MTPEEQAQEEFIRKHLGGRPKGAPAAPAAPPVASQQQVEKQTLGAGLLRAALGRREKDAGL